MHHSAIHRFGMLAILVAALLLIQLAPTGNAVSGNAAMESMKGEAWYGNRIGIEEGVPPPWEPLRLDGAKILVWGREYDFTGGPLPGAMTSANESILSRGVELVLSLNGKADRLEAAKTSIAADAVKTEISGAIYGSGRNPNFEVKTTVEYDGLIWIDISADGRWNGTGKRVSVDIPIRNEHAVYRHVFAEASTGISGAFPPGNGVIDRRQYIPFYWVGDDRRGIFWFCESDQYWPNGIHGDAIQVIRTPGETILRLTIKKEGQKLPDDWHFRFGLQATPVKPLPKNWRKWRLAPARGANVRIHWPEPRSDSLLYYGYPEAKAPLLFSNGVKLAHLRKQKVVPYVCLTFLSAASPEWSRYMSLWAAGMLDATSQDVSSYGAQFAQVSPAGTGWSDFIVWKTMKFLDAFDLDGLYHDNTQPMGIAAPQVGVGYLREGKPRKAYPLMEYRNLYRRMYRALKGLGKETLSIAHMSGEVMIPVLAYEDAYLDGEQFRGKLKDDYMDVLTLDAFRAEFMGRQWGLIPIFLPEFRAPYKNRIEPTRGMMALLMLHDVVPWAEWCNVAVVNEALSALDLFGHADAEFIPYFDSSSPARTAMDNVYVSAYRKNAGSALLIVANLGKTARSGEIVVNRELLHPDRGRVISWPGRKPVERKGNRVFLEIPGQGYSMLFLENVR